jgi:hypothetical protein
MILITMLITNFVDILLDKLVVVMNDELLHVTLWKHVCLSCAHINSYCKKTRIPGRLPSMHVQDDR